MCARKLLVISSLLFFILTPVVGFASSVEVPKFTIQKDAGVISLNCLNGDYCLDLDYKVVADSKGSLSGYGWSDSYGWINFNPKYGGVKINSKGEFFGWAWSESKGWILFDSSDKIASDLMHRFTEKSTDISAVSFKVWLEDYCGVDLTNKTIRALNSFLSCLNNK